MSRRRVLVCGGRNYTDTARVFDVLDEIERDGSVYIIHGGARGADQRAGEWATERGVPCAIVPANWDVYGNGAGPKRNEWMLELHPDLVVAFPGNRGTHDMVTQAMRRGIPVKRIAP